LPLYFPEYNRLGQKAAQLFYPPSTGHSKIRPALWCSAETAAFKQGRLSPRKMVAKQTTQLPVPYKAAVPAKTREVHISPTEANQSHTTNRKLCPTSTKLNNNNLLGAMPRAANDIRETKTGSLSCSPVYPAKKRTPLIQG
jgi:hypothetical protein